MEALDTRREFYKRHPQKPMLSKDSMLAGTCFMKGVWEVLRLVLGNHTVVYCQHKLLVISLDSILASHCFLVLQAKS